MIKDPQYGCHSRELLDVYAESDKFQGIKIKRSHSDAKLSVIVSECAFHVRSRLVERFPKLEIIDTMSQKHFRSSSRTKQNLAPQI